VQGVGRDATGEAGSLDIWRVDLWTPSRDNGRGLVGCREGRLGSLSLEGLVGQGAGPPFYIPTSMFLHGYIWLYR